MNDDLFYVFGEMFPGLRAGERRILAAERQYRWLDGRRLQAVPDKEQSMDSDTTVDEPTMKRVPMPLVPIALADALQDLALLIGDSGRIVTNVHDLPIAFFGRDDVENVNVLVSADRVHVTGNLMIGGHKFGCFSKGFPMGAE